jgi:hypothetical protein
LGTARIAKAQTCENERVISHRSQFQRLHPSQSILGFAIDEPFDGRQLVQPGVKAQVLLPPAECPVENEERYGGRENPAGQGQKEYRERDNDNAQDQRALQYGTSPVRCVEFAIAICAELLFNFDYSRPIFVTVNSSTWPNRLQQRADKSFFRVTRRDVHVQ